jgi:hypothetical protein
MKYLNQPYEELEKRRGNCDFKKNLTYQIKPLSFSRIEKT